MSSLFLMKILGFCLIILHSFISFKKKVEKITQILAKGVDLNIFCCKQYGTCIVYNEPSLICTFYARTASFTNFSSLFMVVVSSIFFGYSMFSKASSVFHWWYNIVLFQNTVNPNIG